ncbi:FlgB family protein [Thetidibacter halocola]|uniref:FlgB family protein n=1 Tax=Thetidibacter halocola TaxID=2827239 RepID=A0A8J8B6T1_9RHOB|nr:FlgB family protein [Thetidibacter halocola]MBS0123662.1 FlgB family protein [Thetidibacter halocola]
MFQNLDVFRTAMAMARHAGHAQAVSAQNIANADTPGYRALDLPDFRQTLRQAAAGQRATRPEHLHGGTERATVAEERRDAMDPNGNTVSLELEMVNAVDAQRQHSRALAIYKSSMTILRTSLGRS